MPVVSSDVFRLAQVKLTGSPPSVPASPTFKVARLSSESLNFQPSTATSSELDPSGQVRDSVLTGARSTGAVELVLARHTFFEEALEAVFRNAFATGTKGDGSGPPPVTSAVGADELIPGDTLSLFMVEKRFRDPSGTYLYHRFDDSAIASMSIAVSPGAEVSASVSYSGGELTMADTIISGATYTDPGVRPVFTAPEVTEITLGGISATLCFQSLNLEFNSNVRGIECIGTLGFREQVLGRFEASITGAAYFVDNSLLQYLVDQTEFAVTVELADSQGNKYAFDYPRCKMTAGNANAGGTGQDVVQNVTIQALYDPTRLYTCIVTRTHVA